MATTAKIAKEAEEAEVQGSPAEPLQALRPAARISAQVFVVPDLLPQAGARGRNSRRDQGELVSGSPELNTTMKGAERNF